MISEWTVTDILNKVTTSADCYNLESTRGWLNMMQSKMRDAWSADLIDIIEREGFTKPICITRNDESYDDEYMLGNGHHRLAIAILTGRETVLVEDDHWMSAESTEGESAIENGYGPESVSDSRWISEQLGASIDRECIYCEQLTEDRSGVCDECSNDM